MSRFQIQPASATDSPEILNLFDRTPQPSLVTLNFDRHPNFFHGVDIASVSSSTWIARERGSQQIIAVVSMGARPVYVNGVIKSLRFGSDLRIAPEYRNGFLLYRLFKVVRQILQPEEWYHSVILDDNEQSLSTIASGRAGFPTYYHCSDYRTHLIYMNRRPSPSNKGLHIRRATAGDSENMQALFNQEAPTKQFYPQYRFNRIGGNDHYYRDLSYNDYYLAFHDDRLVGFCGVWNQQRFKQTRVIDYPAWAGLLRLLYNLKCQTIGGIPLPARGEQVQYLPIHTIITEHNNSEVFHQLLLRILHDYGKSEYSALAVGLDQRDPLRSAIASLPHMQMNSSHYVCSYSGDPRPGIDLDRPVYLELARL